MVSHCFDLCFLMFTELEHLFKSLLVIYIYFREICLHESLKCIIWFSIVDLQIFYIYTCIQNSIQSSSVTQIMSNSLWPHEPQHARPPCPSPTARVYPLMSIESVMPSNHLILCHPLLLLPSIFPSIRVFSSESALCIRWPKYWSFSFYISPYNEHWGPISFIMYSGVLLFS